MQRILLTSISLLAFLLITTATTCDTDQPDTLDQIWIVGSKKTECQGVAVQECFWIKTDGVSSEWELYYDQIDGFEYELGYEYEITVAEETIANPPADASSLKHTLVNVISKEMKESEGLAD